MDYENFNSISEILGSSLESKDEFSNLTKKITLFSFWATVAGKKFEKSTKPYAIRHGKLFVSCQNSYAMQDLLMYKRQLLEKLKPYADGLEIEINDIVLNQKNWNEGHIEIIEGDDANDDINLENADLTAEEHDKIKKMAEKLNFLTDEQREKFAIDVKNNLKVQKIRRG